MRDGRGRVSSANVVRSHEMGAQLGRSRETSLMNLKRIVRGWLEALDDLKAQLEEMLSPGRELQPVRVPKVPSRARTR